MRIWAFRASAHESGSFVVFPTAHALNFVERLTKVRSLDEYASSCSVVGLESRL